MCNGEHDHLNSINTCEMRKKAVKLTTNNLIDDQGETIIDQKCILKYEMK